MSALVARQQSGADVVGRTKVDREQFEKAYGRIIAKAWTDEGFKQRLLSEPTIVLQEHGIEFPEGVEFRMLESTSSLIYLIVPPRPGPEDMEVEDLEKRLVANFTHTYSCF